MGNIHIVGDSNCLLFNNVVQHWLDASTAYNSWKLNSPFLIDIINDFPPTDNCLFFNFGWVDCQRHIYGLEQKTMLPRDFLVHQTVYQYVNFISHLKRVNPSIIFGVMAVHPAGFEDNIYNLEYFPTREIIHDTTMIFNRYLREVTNTFGILFIDIWGEYPEPWTVIDFKDDKAHIKNEIVTEKFGRWLIDFNNSSLLCSVQID